MPPRLIFFFFNDTATTEIYTLSLHDALPISPSGRGSAKRSKTVTSWPASDRKIDRKSTRLNSSHGYISYAVFCLKKKKNTIQKPKADGNLCVSMTAFPSSLNAAH